jgi:hypothetical protein
MHRTLTNIRRGACVLASLLASAQLLPSAALACEGAGTETQKIVIKEIESGEGERPTGKKECRKNPEGTKIAYKVLGEWCEFEIKNENLNEEVEVRSIAWNLPKTGECWEKCLASDKPATGAECKELETKLKPKGANACYEKMFYVAEPKVETPANYDIITKSTGGAAGTAELLQLAK